MTKIISFFLILVMSLSFTVEVLFAHHEGNASSYVMEEDSKQETESKKSKEEKFKAYMNHLSTALLTTAAGFPGISQLHSLPPGYYNKPFTPPDVI